MGLKLQTVAPAKGLQWVRLGFAECFRHPMGYASLFVLFMLTALVLSLLSWLGGVLLLMGVPLLSLAFMMATADSQRGLPVNAAVYLAPWRKGDTRQRRSLLLLCAGLCPGYLGHLGAVQSHRRWQVRRTAGVVVAW